MRIRLMRGRVGVLVRVGAVAVAGAAAALVGSNGWVFTSAQGRLFTPDDAPQRPVALVLGAGVQPDGQPTPFLAARLDVARELLTRGKVTMLLVSGDNRTEYYDEPTAMQRYLVAHGVPADRIVMDFAGRDTYDSCVRARRIFGVEQVTLVSQRYHLPRALAVCRAVGVDAIGVGDTTMQSYAPAVWTQGVIREIPAAVKAAADVLTHRDPVLGPEEPALRERLAVVATKP